LSEFLSDLDQRDALATGLLLQAVRCLAMPPACVEQIEQTLVEFVKEDWERRKPAKQGLPGQMRVFCQRKIIDVENAGRTALQPHLTGQATEQAPMFGKKLNGGWGFFLIERGGSLSPGFAARLGHSVDVYLYKEGE
jgi:hypothetical protein